MELSDFLILEPGEGEDDGELNFYTLDGKLRLIGTIDLYFRDEPNIGYCVDYYYNGKGVLHESKSWTLDHINRHDDAVSGGNETRILMKELDKKLKPLNVTMWDIFYLMVLKRLEQDYPTSKHTITP